MYAHEVAAKLIDEKKQELKDGTSRRDVLSLLGSSRLSFTSPGIWYNFQFFSQGKFRSATRLATERRGNRRPSQVRQHLGQVSSADLKCRTTMFAGHDTTSKVVSSSCLFTS